MKHRTSNAIRKVSWLIPALCLTALCGVVLAFLLNPSEPSIPEASVSEPSVPESIPPIVAADGSTL